MDDHWSRNDVCCHSNGTLNRYCTRYRQILQRKNTEDTGNIQNEVHEGDTRPDTELPQIPHTDGDYEQPAQYAQTFQF